MEEGSAYCLPYQTDLCGSFVIQKDHSEFYSQLVTVLQHSQSGHQHQ